MLGWFFADILVSYSLRFLLKSVVLYYIPRKKKRFGFIIIKNPCREGLGYRSDGYLDYVINKIRFVKLLGMYRAIEQVSTTTFRYMERR